MSLSNVWGLFAIIVLLGYGLVAIPRNCWHRGNLERTLALNYFNAAILDEDAVRYRKKLTKNIREAHELDKKVPDYSD